MPFAFASASETGTPLLVSRTKNRLEKSMRPSARPIGGMMMPSTSEGTILPNAAPMMTPTARSTTLPRAMNSRNSLAIGMRALWRGCPGHDDPGGRRHRVEVIHEPLRFGSVIFIQVVRPTEANWLIEQLHADAEGTATAGHRHRIVHGIAAASEVRIVFRRAVDAHARVRSCLVEAAWQQAVILQVLRRGEQPCRRHAVRIAQNRLVDLYLVGAGDPVVMRFELRRVRIVVVSLNQSGIRHGAGFKHNTAVAITHRQMEPCAPRRVSGRELVSRQILHVDVDVQCRGRELRANDGNGCSVLLQLAHGGL